MDVVAAVGKRDRKVPASALLAEVEGGRLTPDGFLIDRDPRTTWTKPPKLVLRLAGNPTLRWERAFTVRYDCNYEADFRGRDGAAGQAGPAGRDGDSGEGGGVGLRGSEGEDGAVGPVVKVRVTRVAAERGDLLQIVAETDDGRGGSWAIAPGGRLSLRVGGGTGGRGGDGGSGGRGGIGNTAGGDGGAGGLGGDGANGGAVRILADAGAYARTNDQIVVDVSGGSGGEGGAGGASGLGGRGKKKAVGKNGMTGPAGADGHGAADGPAPRWLVGVSEPLW